MTVQSKATNKANFQTGDVPTQAQFIDLIDSYQDYSTLLAAIAVLTPIDGNVIVGNGATWVAESGATARTSLGLGTGDSPQFTGIQLGLASDTTLARAGAGLASIEGDNILTANAAQAVSNKEMDAENNTFTGFTIGAEVSNSIATDLLPAVTSTHGLGSATFVWSEVHTDQLIVGGTLIDGTVLADPGHDGPLVWDSTDNEEVYAALATGLIYTHGSTTLGLSASLTDLHARWSPASAAGAAYLDFAEDTDNGTNRVRLQGPASTGDITLTLPDAAGTLLATADPATLVAGFNATDYDAGTKSTGAYTPDPANSNFQRAVNGGAHTLAAPESSCCIVIQYTNNSGAGAITTSGFTKVSGDSFSTTDGHDFLCHITRCNGFSHLHVTALQ